MQRLVPLGSFVETGALIFLRGSLADSLTLSAPPPKTPSITAPALCRSLRASPINLSKRASANVSRSETNGCACGADIWVLSAPARLIARGRNIGQSQRGCGVRQGPRARALALEPPHLLGKLLGDVPDQGCIDVPVGSRPDVNFGSCFKMNNPSRIIEPPPPPPPPPPPAAPPPSRPFRSVKSGICCGLGSGRDGPVG